MVGIQGGGLGFVLPLILLALTALIVLLSGSGTALFFAMVPLMVPLAAAAGINVLAISIPMGLAGNLLRAVSPVSAVTMIVAGSVKRSPIEVVKRTSLPMIVGHGVHVHSLHDRVPAHGCIALSAVRPSGVIRRAVCACGWIFR